MVSVDGQPSTGLDVTFVDTRTGAVQRARSGAGGLFKLEVEPGQYVVAAEGNAGLGIERAPGLVSVQAARTARVEVDLLPMAGARLGQAGPPDSGAIVPDPIACFVDDYCPVVTARIEPPEGTVRARLSFRGLRSSERFYVEMTRTPEGFVARLPRPDRDGGSVRYSISAVGASGQVQETPEVTVPIVDEARDCPQGPVAPSRSGDVVVYAAATGERAMPPDFDDCGSKLPLVLLGAAGAGIVTGILVFAGEEAPAPATPSR